MKRNEKRTFGSFLTREKDLKDEKDLRDNGKMHVTYKVQFYFNKLFQLSFSSFRSFLRVRQEPQVLALLMPNRLKQRPYLVVTQALHPLKLAVGLRVRKVVEAFKFV